MVHRLKTNEAACRCAQPKKAYTYNSKCPKCSKCGSHFTFIDTVHICVHDGKMVHKCRIVYDMCNYVSDTMWEMKRHLSAEHGGKKYVFKEYHKKRYECSFCGKVFEQNDSLKNNMLLFMKKKRLTNVRNVVAMSLKLWMAKNVINVQIVNKALTKKVF